MAKTRPGKKAALKTPDGPSPAEAQPVAAAIPPAALAEADRHLLCTQVEVVELSSLNHDPANARLHDEDNLTAIMASLRSFGQDQPLVVQRAGRIVRKGNGRMAAMKRLGWRKAAVVFVDEDNWQAVARALADNRTAELGAWDGQVLSGLLQGLRDQGHDQELKLGWSAKEIAKLLKAANPAPGDGGDGFDASAKDGPFRTAAGELWVLGGKHRLLVGDSTHEEPVKRLFAGIIPTCILTDPPYCSGGFQEIGKSAGSIGTDAKITPRIANDRLSTRGYMALMKAAIGKVACPMAYVFTDWRMWVNLFDVMESSGFGVRNMIVWNKGSPGMGLGWRAQHELVMFAARASVKFDNRKAQGNVIGCDRTGNPDHPTQKPIELLTKILDVTDMAETIYDPFAGSGTTLVAAHRLGRACYLAELEPRFADVILRRAEAEGLACEKAEAVEARPATVFEEEPEAKAKEGEGVAA